MKLLAFVAGYLGPLFWVAVAAALAFTHGGAYIYGYSNAKSVAELREARATAAANEAIAIEQARQREIEQRYATNAASAAQELAHARQTIAEQDRLVRDLRAAASGLRIDLAAFAAGGTCEDPGAPGGTRAGALAELAADGADLLADGGELLRACARDHDERAAEVRALIQAWPTQ